MTIKELPVLNSKFTIAAFIFASAGAAFLIVDNFETIAKILSYPGNLHHNGKMCGETSGSAKVATGVVIAMLTLPAAVGVFNIGMRVKHGINKMLLRNKSR
ncbi:MAG: hypothetical protein LBG89_01100 [Rickettsiales bacterium]|nr:hypothetical protein [Rickettsiales bacterium]